MFGLLDLLRLRQTETSLRRLACETRKIIENSDRRDDMILCLADRARRRWFGKKVFRSDGDATLGFRGRDTASGGSQFRQQSLGFINIRTVPIRNPDGHSSWVIAFTNQPVIGQDHAQTRSRSDGFHANGKSIFQPRPGRFISCPCLPDESQLHIFSLDRVHEQPIPYIAYAQDLGRNHHVRTVHGITALHQGLRIFCRRIE